MPDVTVAAELQRRNAAAALVDWVLVADASSATGLADPVIDAAARASLVSILNQLTAGIPLSASTLAALETISVANFPASQAVTGPLTDTQLRATPVPVSGTVTATTGGLTDTQLRASAVPVSGPATDTQLRATPLPVSGTVGVSGTVEIANDTGNPLPVSGTVTATGPLTDTQLRATAVPISGALTDSQLRATPVPVSGTVATGGLTDTQLRATPVPVSGTVTATTGGLTDTQLRASRVDTLDKYLGGQVLADQAGAGAVLTFTFTTAVDLVWVLSTGTGTSRADPFGGTPAASLGIPCPADTQQPITVTTSSVKVFAPSGTTVSVWGYRY